MNRKVRVFDRPGGKGLIGTITEVYDEFNFRFITDNGKEYEFSTTGQFSVQVTFLDEGETDG